MGGFEAKEFLTQRRQDAKKIRQEGAKVSALLSTDYTD